jgi:hypothetical protein
MRTTISSLIARELRATSGKKNMKENPPMTTNPDFAGVHGVLFDITDEAISEAAKVIADHIGHGMREKCLTVTKAALAAALPRAKDEAAIREQVRREVVDECAELCDARGNRAIPPADVFDPCSVSYVQTREAKSCAAAIRALAAGKEVGNG